MIDERASDRTPITGDGPWRRAKAPQSYCPPAEPHPAWRRVAVTKGTGGAGPRRFRAPGAAGIDPLAASTMRAVQRIDFAPATGLKLLVVGAHPDDIEIGCGGTVLRLVGEGRLADVRWVVLSGSNGRAAEARSAAAAILGDTSATLDVRAFRDGYFPFAGEAIKEAFEEIKAGFEPDLVLTHRRADLHQDHRLVAELTSQTFRDHLILEYEVPKWDGDLSTPNLYVTLTADVAEAKARLLASSFPSQAGRHWFSRETFLGLARIRGIECRAPDGYAEGFHARKLVW
jgi:LmbE family N-acetylglucosaminyl deacetylase